MHPPDDVASLFAILDSSWMTAFPEEYRHPPLPAAVLWLHVTPENIKSPPVPNTFSNPGANTLRGYSRVAPGRDRSKWAGKYPQNFPDLTSA